VTTARNYLRLRRSERALANEALFELARAVILVNVVGWTRYSRRLGAPASGAPQPSENVDSALLDAIGRAVERWERVSRNSVTCLVQSIAAQRMLGRRGVVSAVVLGVRMDGPDDIGAHSWLSVGRHVVVGRSGMPGHTTVAHFMSGSV
jgi:hypothetical protein